MTEVHEFLSEHKPHIKVKIAPIGVIGWIRICIIILAIIFIGSRLYAGVYSDIAATAVGDSLSSLSVSGSIITGLCITGVSAMEGGFLKRLTRTYGDHLRSVFFAWFTFVSAVIIASTVLRAVPDTLAARLVASYMPPILFAAVTGLSYSVFKIYRIEEEVTLDEGEASDSSSSSDDS